MKLENKVVIVTGASAGMGKAISYLFAQEGATVYAVARRVERLEELAKSAEEVAGKIIPCTADLMIKEEVERIVDFAYNDAGKIDILVNNAGIMDDFSPAGDVSDEIMEKVFQLNYYAPFYSIRKAIGIFLKQKEGNIINIASIGGLYGARAGVAYTASKHAVIGLTKNTGYMYAKENIRCNAICPGGVETEIGTGAFMKDINQKAMGIIMPGMAGNPRTGSPEEIAKIALFLATSDSGFINGQCIVADSGWTAM